MGDDMIAEIIINTSARDLDKIFDYNVPKELENDIKLGKRVLVQFGNRKQLDEGFVVGFKEKSEYKLKDISKVQDGFFISEENIKMAKWISENCFCNLSDSIKLMLPPGTKTNILSNRIKDKSLDFVYLNKDNESIENDIKQKVIKSEKQIRVLKFLQENDEVSTSDLELFTDTSRAVLNSLEKKGYIEIIR